jgi:dienelactone hydrolase
MRNPRILLLLSVIMLCCQAPAARAQAAATFAREELLIPMAAAGPAGLEALLVKPAGDGPFPLALINHGSPRNAAERPLMTPAQMNAQLVEFARRGFVAVAVMRRGYGASPGGWAEGIGACAHPGYASAGAAGAADLRSAVAYLSTRPDVDAKRVLAVGISAGGFATVALTADPPKGLVAAISFAGGRGSEAPDTVCSENELVAAFAGFGARSRVPMLWVYAENDHFFGPALAQRFKDAFASAGGQVSFVKAPAFGEDGHLLFSSPGEAVWEPIVDDFLRAQGLVPIMGILPPPPLPEIAAPRGLGASGKEAFRSYLASPPHKAFATGSGGAFGWRSARRSDEEAIAGALAACGGKVRADCNVVLINDQPAGK